MKKSINKEVEQKTILGVLGEGLHLKYSGQVEPDTFRGWNLL